MTELTGLMAGIKIAVFLLVLVYAYLSHLRMDKFDFRWLAVTAASFITISLVEFLVALDQNAGPEIFAWIVNLQNKALFTEAVFLVAGVGMLMFLNSVKEEEVN